MRAYCVRIHALMISSCRVHVYRYPYFALIPVDPEVLWAAVESSLKMAELTKACRKGDFDKVKKLISEGHDINQSADEWSGLTPLIEASRCGHNVIVKHLVDHGADVNKSDKMPNTALLWACKKGHPDVVCTLLAAGANTEAIDRSKKTPIIAAVANSAGKRHIYLNTIKALILAGARVNHKDENGDTALHFAARDYSTRFGITLVEAGADVRAKNHALQTPLDSTTIEFKTAVLHAMSFSSKKTICVIGNAYSGKSTLIASLQNEQASFSTKVSNRIYGVKDISQRTAGIEPVSFDSRKYGNVVFFDFAGQHEYHGPHAMFLQSVLKRSGAFMTVVLVVKVLEDKAAILQQLYRWLTPISDACTHANPVKVILVGSFMDQVQNKAEIKEKVFQCYQIVQKDLNNTAMDFKDACFLNCRQPYSSGIDKLCQYLHEVPVPYYKTSDMPYSICWVISHLHKSLGTKNAIKLSEFEDWKKKNRYFLPYNIPSAEVVCNDLSATGHFLYLANQEAVSKSWLVLDLSSILHTVYGTLFSPFKNIVDTFGLLDCQMLPELFPTLDAEMIRDILISLEFCIEVDPTLLKREVATLKNTSGDFLFFPSLVSAQPPEVLKDLLSDTDHPKLCWELQTTQKHFISPGLLHGIILRLAACYVFHLKLGPDTKEHCCSVWCNGIFWQSVKGIDVAVQISDNSVIHVVGSSKAGPDLLIGYVSDVTKSIIDTVHQVSPNLFAVSCLIHTADPFSILEQHESTPAHRKFPVSIILSSLEEGGKFCLSRPDQTGHSNSVLISALLSGGIPTQAVLKRLCFVHIASGK